jgi:hypothetical protein
VPAKPRDDHGRLSAIVSPKKRRNWVGPIGHPNPRRGICGLCGASGDLSKTHIPPQSSGNTGKVERFTVINDPYHNASRGKSLVGGMHIFGLCAACNTNVQGRWDALYTEMADGMRSSVRDTNKAALIEPASVLVSPGGVARFVLSSAFALNPMMRTRYPDIARQLRVDDPEITLPDGSGLYLAATPPPHALISGLTGGLFLLGKRIDGLGVGLSSLAQIYFPPLAWQLCDKKKSHLVHLQRWADVSHWLKIAPNIRQDLRDACPPLPLVVHPKSHPLQWEWWGELISNKITFILHSDNVSP